MNLLQDWAAQNPTTSELPLDDQINNLKAHINALLTEANTVTGKIVSSPELEAAEIMAILERNQQLVNAASQLSSFATALDDQRRIKPVNKTKLYTA